MRIEPLVPWEAIRFEVSHALRWPIETIVCQGNEPLSDFARRPGYVDIARGVETHYGHGEDTRKEYADGYLQTTHIAHKIVMLEFRVWSFELSQRAEDIASYLDRRLRGEGVRPRLQDAGISFLEHLPIRPLPLHLDAKVSSGALLEIRSLVRYEERDESAAIEVLESASVSP